MKPDVSESNSLPLPDAPGGPSGPGQSEKDLRWVLFGEQGLRAGWSVAIFASVYYLSLPVIDTLLVAMGWIHPQEGFAPVNALFIELAPVLSMMVAAVIVAHVERRRALDYNLRGPRRALRFGVGAVAGFAALSLLVGVLDAGGWLRLARAGLNEASMLEYAAIWAVFFLMVGCLEEGTMRCYLLFTLTRGLNFWWAAAAAAAMCGYLLIVRRGESAWGVYLIALAGVVPCWVLGRAGLKSAGFWQATWISSMFFAMGHTTNRGETWLGIFAAGAIGAVWCASVRVTGSALWAIGCHAAWDWGETYFYGAADSGMVARGHYLTTSPAGPVLWSGGSDGPEGSVLVLGAILLLLAVVLLIYGRRQRAAQHASMLERAAS